MGEETGIVAWSMLCPRSGKCRTARWRPPMSKPVRRSYLDNAPLLIAHPLSNAWTGTNAEHLVPDRTYPIGMGFGLNKLGIAGTNPKQSDETEQPTAALKNAVSITDGGRFPCSE
jgi:hypothetical protein